MSLIGCVGLAVTGCATSQMETARQLDDGQVVAAATVEMPGSYIVMPRGSVNVRYGFPVGDVGGHLATSLFLLHGGATLRLYPSEWIIFSVQADYVTSLPDIVEPLDGHLTITPRLSTTAEGDRFLYGGIEAPIPVDIDTQPYTVDLPRGATIERRDIWVRGGVFGGVDWLFKGGRGWGLQSEVIFKPMVVTTDNTVELSFLEGVEPAIQFTVGTYFRTGERHRRGKQRLEPTDQGEPSPPRRREVPPEPEPEPERTPEPDTVPDYDDDGVPVY